MKPFEFTDVPSSATVSSLVTVLVAGWFVLASGAILSDQHRQNQVLLRDLAGQELQIFEAKTELAEIDAGNAVLLAQGLQRRDVGDRPVGREARCETSTLLLGERPIQLLGTQGSLPKQDFAELLLLGHFRKYRPKGRS